jgi:hypothetical protein
MNYRIKHGGQQKNVSFQICNADYCAYLAFVLFPQERDFAVKILCHPFIRNGINKMTTSNSLPGTSFVMHSNTLLAYYLYELLSGTK